MIDLEDGGGHGRVMHEVIAVGEDSQWIVAAQHPGGNEERTLYYYFTKGEDAPPKNADEIVQGHFSAFEYQQRKKDLDLPDFSETF